MFRYQTDCFKIGSLKVRLTFKINLTETEKYEHFE
jgi:hypothetical protein